MTTRGLYSQYDHIRLNFSVHAYKNTPTPRSEQSLQNTVSHELLYMKHFITAISTNQVMRQSKINAIEEQIVVNWIIGQDRIGWPPTVAQVRKFATYILESHHDFNPLGINWIRGFKRRNPEVATMIGRKIDRERSDGTSIEALNSFFQEIKRVKDEHQVKP
jgi:hypothetical protein